MSSIAGMPASIKAAIPFYYYKGIRVKLVLFLADAAHNCYTPACGAVE